MSTTDRINGLTDAVLAIALTILVLGFEVPEHDFSRDGFSKFLYGLREPALAYVVSFGIIATYWVQHAAIALWVCKANRPFVWLNLAFLLPVTLLPFLTGLRAEYHHVYSVTVLYAGVNVVSCAMLLAIWKYALGHGLVHEGASRVDRTVSHRLLISIGINALGALVAPIDVRLSGVAFLMLPMLYFSHRMLDEESASIGEHA